MGRGIKKAFSSLLLCSFDLKCWRRDFLKRVQGSDVKVALGKELTRERCRNGGELWAKRLY